MNEIKIAVLANPTCTWSGILPPPSSKSSGFSNKVFLGGVPWDISEQTLMQTFSQFGPIRVEWPGKDKQACQPKGYVYIIFESEKNVKDLLQACTNDYADPGNWYYKISSKRMKAKEVLIYLRYFFSDILIVLTDWIGNILFVGTGDPLVFVRFESHPIAHAEARPQQDGVRGGITRHADGRRSDENHERSV